MAFSVSVRCAGGNCVSESLFRIVHEALCLDDGRLHGREMTRAADILRQCCDNRVLYLLRVGFLRVLNILRNPSLGVRRRRDYPGRRGRIGEAWSHTSDPVSDPGRDWRGAELVDALKGLAPQLQQLEFTFDLGHDTLGLRGDLRGQQPDVPRPTPFVTPLAARARSRRCHVRRRREC